MELLANGICSLWNFHCIKTIIIYTVCLAIVFGADIAKVFMAGKIRKRLTPHNIHNISRLNGLILIGFGLVLLWGLIFFADKLK